MKHPTLQQFKAWARSHAQLGHAVVMAQAFAQCKREQVDAYIKPVFELFDFYVSDQFVARGMQRERITDINRLYMTDLQGADYLAFLHECDVEHRKHGYKGKPGHCPALEAEELQRIAEHALLKAGSDLFGVDFCDVYGDNRKKALDLLIGATLKAYRRAA